MVRDSITQNNSATPARVLNVRMHIRACERWSVDGGSGDCHQWLRLRLRVEKEITVDKIYGAATYFVDMSG